MKRVIKGTSNHENPSSIGKDGDVESICQKVRHKKSALISLENVALSRESRGMYRVRPPRYRILFSTRIIISGVHYFLFCLIVCDL